jgi:hypothetical protein
MGLLNCWEYHNCERQKGGSKVAELGECVASEKKLGKSCWAIAGTLCKGETQGDVAQKMGNCMFCEVYLDYNRINGRKKSELISRCEGEQRRYIEFLKGSN